MKTKFAVITIMLLMLGVSNVLAQQQSISLYVNMHCESCKIAITNKLVGIDGISNVEADLFKKQVNVVFDKSKITENQIIDTIKELGYEVKPKKNSKTEKHQTKKLKENTSCTDVKDNNKGQ